MGQVRKEELGLSCSFTSAGKEEAMAEGTWVPTETLCGVQQINDLFGGLAGFLACPETLGPIRLPGCGAGPLPATIYPSYPAPWSSCYLLLSEAQLLYTGLSHQASHGHLGGSALQLLASEAQVSKETGQARPFSCSLH